jgi:hypothetical protein
LDMKSLVLTPNPLMSTLWQVPADETDLCFSCFCRYSNVEYYVD